MLVQSNQAHVWSSDYYEVVSVCDTVLLRTAHLRVTYPA